MLSSTFHLGLPDDPLPADFYGRAANPTWRALEAAIGGLDGGDCVSFASGMAAIAAVLRLPPGPAALVLPSDGYYVSARSPATSSPARRRSRGAHPGTVARRRARRRGPRAPRDALQPGPRRVRHRAAAAAAHAAGALLAVDNTTATPLGQRPLELGADLTVASDTKALAGHGDVVLGHVTAPDPALAHRLRELRTRGGAGPGPMEAWLAHRGLATLDLRLARQAANAAALVEALRAHPAVAAVRWPGHPADPAHAIARSQMRRWNGVVGMPSGPRRVGRFLAASRYAASATSFGGVRTTADRRQRWGDAVAPGFLRLSVGCEDADDLVADVAPRSTPSDRRRFRRNITLA